MDKTLKILAFSDLHCDVAAAATIARMAPQFDLIIGAGDFATMRRGLAKTIDELRSIEQPTVVVPGNGESYEELQAACRDWPAVLVLHGNGTTIDGVPVFGIGGAIPTTPFGSWSYDFTEEQASQMLESCPDRCILVSHSPPQGMVDRSSFGQHLGSKSVREIIDRRKPRLVICGHVHDSWRQSVTFEQTTIVNAGPQPFLLELRIAC